MKPPLSMKRTWGGGGVETILFTNVSLFNDTKKTNDHRFVKFDGITLSVDSLPILIGNFATLTASILPSNATNKGVTWSVSDETKVTIIPNGLSLGINAISSGNVTITCTSVGDPTKSASCEVSVMGLPVESIILDRTEITMGLGGSEPLYATVLPETAQDKSVSWSNDSDYTNTIREYNGHLVIDNKHYGIDTITCTSNENPNIKATCSVRVVPPELYVTDIEDHRSEVVWDEDLMLNAILPASSHSALRYTFECDGRDFTQYTYDEGYEGLPDGFAVINPCQFTKTGDNTYLLSTDTYCYATEPNVVDYKTRTIPFNFFVAVEDGLMISIDQNINFNVKSIEESDLVFSIDVVDNTTLTYFSIETVECGEEWPWLKNYLYENLAIKENGEIFFDKDTPLDVRYAMSHNGHDYYEIYNPNTDQAEFVFQSGDVLTMTLGGYEVTRTLE